MSRPRSTRGLLVLVLSAVLLASCGQHSSHYRIEARFKNLDQGELFLYDAQSGRRDTVALRDGRFAIERTADDTLVLMLTFPNMSEIPVVVEPGAKVKVEGDASHLKETTVKGTKANDRMTIFRLNANNQTPPEQAKAAEQYIKANPSLPESRYLLNRYFINTPQPDYKKAAQLADTISRSRRHDTSVTVLARQLKSLAKALPGTKLPPFAAPTVDGAATSNNALDGDANLVYLWATWDYEGTNAQRELKQLKRTYGSRLKIVGICVDAAKEDCRRTLERDTITWPVVCDGDMFLTQTAQRLGLATLPGNVITDRQGRVVAKNTPYKELKEKLEELLGK